MSWFTAAYTTAWNDTLHDVLGEEFMHDGMPFIAVLDEAPAERIESDGVDYVVVTVLRISTPSELEIGDWVEYYGKSYRLVEREQTHVNRYTLEHREIINEHDPRLHR